MRRKATVAALIAMACFTASNFFWRFASLDAPVLAGWRCLVGAVLLVPMSFRFPRGAWKVLRYPSVIALVVSQAITVTLAAAMFLSVPGPLAGVALSLIPIITAGFAALVGLRRLRRRQKILIALAGSAGVLAASADLADIAIGAIAVALAFAVGDSIGNVINEAARSRHNVNPSLVVMVSLFVGAPVGILMWIADGRPTLERGDYVAIIGVAVVGTLGRVLVSWSMRWIGGAEAAMFAQLVAVATAVGGVIFFDDVLHLATAAGLAIIAFAVVLFAIETSRVPQPAEYEVDEVEVT